MSDHDANDDDTNRAANRDTKLVRTRVGGDSHALVVRETLDEPIPFGSLSGDDADDVLAVTDDSPGAFLDSWRDRVGTAPRNVGVVGVGNRMRSATAETPSNAGGPPGRKPGEARSSERASPGRDSPGRNVVRGVADPADTVAIHDAAAGYLDVWPDHGETVAYIDSLGTLLDRLDPAAAVGFLADFRRTLTEQNAVGYFCLTRSVHDPTSVRAVTSAFDTVIECVGESDESE
ncbi:DUF7504 family protein [Halorussus amylolyticus]|uniref:DUF7504 family protein n=1 Tax=Halorussus amylolyticus TaxID=1126242 RepID=UPI0010480622|nr:hypothetical protein [Halorussus amylolyticus]